jgi:hypothetical protein
MRVSPNSLLIAALATSTSMSYFVNAAPTPSPDGSGDSTTTTSETASPAAAPGAPDLTSILGNLTPSTRRAPLSSESLDTRQLGLLDELTSIVDTVLEALGLNQQGASTSSTLTNQLGPDQVSHITDLVKSMTSGLNLPVPLALPLIGRSNSGVQPGSPTPGMDTNHFSRRTKPDWMNHGADRSSGSAKLPISLGKRSDPDWKDHADDTIIPLSVSPASQSVGASGVEVEVSGLPVEPPVQPPTGVPPPIDMSQGNNSATLPSVPAGVPPLPIGAPSLPFGNTPSFPIQSPMPLSSHSQATSMNSNDSPLPALTA